MDDYTKLMYKEFGLNVSDDILQLYKKQHTDKRTYEEAFREECESERMVSSQNLKAILRNDMVNALKIRDKFVNTAFNSQTERKIDDWCRRELLTISKKEKNDDVNVYERCKIMLPTEESINSYNMLVGQSYEYSKYSDRDANMPFITWSGFNYEYKAARNDAPFIQALISFTILEKLSKDLFHLNANDFVQSYDYQQSTETIEHAVEEILDSMVQEVYHGILKEIDMYEFLPEAIKYADYMNSIGFIGYSVCEHQTPYSFYERNHLLSCPPVNKLVDIRDMVVLGVQGEGKIGLNVNSEKQIFIVVGVENTIKHHLHDELRYCEFMHQFVLKSTPFRYIITDDRSKKDDEDDADNKSNKKFSEMYSAAMRATNKTEAEADRMKFKIHEMKIKASSDRERRLYRNKLRERADKLSKLRSEYAEDKFRALRKAATERERNDEINRQFRQLSELNKMQSAHELMQDKFLMD